MATSTWGELASALARVDIRVRGEEHLWEKRPAVFIFNHQSGVDALVICRLLQRDFVGVSKKELESNPNLGPALSLTGTVFVDRFHPTKAASALEPAVEAPRRHWLFVRPTTIEVVVRPPIETRDWTRVDLPQRMRKIRDDYLEVIAS